MKILIGTHAFAPSIGGLETCSLDLAQAFSRLGHEIRVLTQTPSGQPDDDHGLQVVRRPDKVTLKQAIRWCDVFFQNNISLQTAWPLLFIRKPWVVCTQTWLKADDGSSNWAGRIKLLALRSATNVYISPAVRNHVGYPGVSIPNPYRSGVFRQIPGLLRARRLVFLGRLVSDKGCDLLIESVARLRDSGLLLPLTIIGGGPEEATLKALIVGKKLQGLVRFAGVLTGEALARELNRHEVLVVPSRWPEPFGIVALEGIACGCLVVGSSGGGLPDAIGPCGVTFKNGDSDDLVRALREVLTWRETRPDLPAAITGHLNGHQVETIATRFLEVFQGLSQNH